MAKETIHMTRDLYDEILVTVATKERERIIKVLNSWQCLTNECSCWSTNTVCDTRDGLIAFIKAENK